MEIGRTQQAEAGTEATGRTAMLQIFPGGGGKRQASTGGGITIVETEAAAPLTAKSTGRRR